MQKPVAICMAALLLLAGCLSTDETEEILSIVGCEDENSLTYVENATEFSEDFCVYEDILEDSIVEFINMIENGPDMDTLDSTVGYTMEVSEAVDDETWHYMETMIVSPDGYKVTYEDNYGDNHSIGEIIMSGNEIQYYLNNETEDFTVRMKHAGTFEEAFEMMMSGDDMMMGDDDDEYSDDEMVCYDMSTHMILYEHQNQITCEEEGYMWVPADSGPGGDDGTEGRQTGLSIEFFEDYEMVTIAVTGQFSDDIEASPYYTLMIIKSGNDPEYALVNIQADDLYNDWDYIEEGYAEKHISKDWLLSNYFDIEFSVWHQSESSENAVSSQYTFFVAEDDGSDPSTWEDDDVDEMEVELDDDGNPDPTFYTGLYNPLSATMTGFAADETGYTFMGSLNYEGSPFSYLEIHTDSDFTVLGFTMEDTEEEDNWVEFMMIHSGETMTDDTIPLSALPYILVDMSEFDDGEGDEQHYGEDYIDWNPYYGGYCEWEGNPDDDDNVWSCKEDQSDQDWDTWWYYCELHDGDWFCTDDFGESSDYANSANNDRYTNGYDGGDDDDSDDDEITSLDDFDVSSWDSTNDLEQIVDWFNVNYMYEEDELVYQVDDFLSLCDASPDYIDYYVAECVFDSAMNMLYNDDEEYVEEFHYYDNCTDENGSYECWMDEWDYDGDGDYEESHGFAYSDCSLESNGSWMCFTGWEDDYEDSEEFYACIPFVEYTSAGFSIFNNSSLDESMCGMEIIEDTHEFDNSTFTMPTHLIWEQCWEEDNGTECETGEIYYDVNTTMLWETIHENNYMDCDGDYDNNTSMCTEWIGNVTEADGSAFIISHPDQDILALYQYDSATQSGLFIATSSSLEDYDDEWSFDREMQDCDSDGDAMVTYSELEACINEDLINDGIDQFNASTMGAYGFFNMTDINEDGMLNESEFNELNAILSSSEDGDMDPEMMFAIIDSNDDGEVTASEWADASNQSDEPMSQDDIDNLTMMIGLYDEDDSGGLNFDEFVNMMDNMDNEEGDMNPEMMFYLFDANEDGEVTASEWFDFSNQTDDPMSEEDFGFFAAMMDNYDEDDSGGLDFDEFMTFMNGMEDSEDSEPDVAMYMAFGLLHFAEADVNDYMVQLAMCEGEEITDLECEDAVYSVLLADIMASSEEEAMMALMSGSMVFVDSDDSGTLTNGDYLMINKDMLDVDGEWNFARLYSSESGSYADENPMMSMLPGFTGIFATIGLLGAALIRRE